MKKIDRDKIYSNTIPWGCSFAKSSTFYAGHSPAEAYFVTKYFRSPDNVLLIGSGNGREARPICHRAKRVVCMDIGWLYLRSGQRLFKVEKVENVSYVQADMVRLPFVKQSFDFIFFYLYTIAGINRFEIMKNIGLILRPSGLVLLMCCTPCYREIKKKEFPEGTAFISTMEELKSEISFCGFDLLETMVDWNQPEYRFSIIQAKPARL
jgi:ubiquinone/menaquinone biosynthesis C-methylase UbiE